MRNLFTVTKVSVVSLRIEYEYTIEGPWSKYFTSDKFFIEYSRDISSVPESVCVIPLLAAVLPIAWLCDACISVPCVDKDFYDSIEQFKNGYRQMYPMLEFRGSLNTSQVQKNTVKAQTKSLCFFSGGVDAFNTLTQHYKENSYLFTLWGADVWFDDEKGWNAVLNHIESTSNSFNLEYITAKSSLRYFINYSELTKLVQESKDNWWHGFQHGIGIISHAAPLAYLLGIQNVYFASSFTLDDKGKVTCASDPTIDNFVKFCGCDVHHDGYEYNRQQKIHNIITFSKQRNISIPVRVCWESKGGSNCCSCEKCFRTILGFYAEKADPKEYGFEYGNLDSVLHSIKDNRPLAYKKYVYTYIQDALRKNYTIKEVNKNLRWFYKADLSRKYVDISFKHLLKATVRRFIKIPSVFMFNRTQKTFYKISCDRFLNSFNKQTVNKWKTDFQERLVRENVFSNKEKRRMVKDFLFLCHVTGCEPEDYFTFSLYTRKLSLKMNLVTRWRQNVFQYNVNKINDCSVLDDKVKFNTFFADLIKRDWTATLHSDRGEINNFFEQNNEVIIKPLSGSGGKGVYKVVWSLLDEDSKKQIIDDVNGKPFVMESVLKQNGFLNQINPASVNTLRVNTLIDGDKKLCLYRDIKKLKAHFLEYAPEDKKMINRLCRDISYFKNVHLPVNDVAGIKTKHHLHPSLIELMKMAPAGLRYARLEKMSYIDYVNQFKNERNNSRYNSNNP